MAEILVPAAFGEADLEEKRSKFTGRVWPVETEAEALSYLRQMREKYWDATHNVYAYSIYDGGIARFSDDGEPSGTSGMPVMNVFRSAGIDNFCCVVTRYFGGILLGAGGLVRAYSKTAALALENAGRAKLMSLLTAEVDCSYPQFERLRNELERLGGTVENVDYGERVTISFSVTASELDGCRMRARELTAGSAEIRITGEARRPVKI